MSRPIGPISTAAPAAGWERALQIDAGAAGDTASVTDTTSAEDTGSAEDTASAGGTLVQVRHTLTSRLRDSYPVGARDLEIGVTRGTADGVALAVEGLFGADPECRRIILAVPDGDQALAQLAEAAGLRAVVEVELPGGDDVVLWVAEPATVTAQSIAVDDLPQT